MPSAKFIGDPSERERDLPPSRNFIDWFGVNFRLGDWVDVSKLSGEQIAALKNSNHFEFSEGSKRTESVVREDVVDDPAPAPAPAPAPKSAKAKPAAVEGPAEPSETSDDI